MKSNVNHGQGEVVAVAPRNETEEFIDRAIMAKNNLEILPLLEPQWSFIVNALV